MNITAAFPMRLIAVIASILISYSTVEAQNNLSVSYPSQSAAPDFLNICGDHDTMIIRVGLDGISPEIRRNIIADVDFFKGVRYMGILPALSSPGVSENTIIDEGRVEFNVPDLSPASETFADVAVLLQADCNYLDTIAANNTATVVDIWNFEYFLGTTPGLQEIDFTPQYRDAFVSAAYQMQVNTSTPPLAVTDCFTREVQIDNSGLLGYVDTLEYTSTQGSGLFVSQVRANGVPLAISKTVNLFGDTIITAILDGTHFSLNTIGAGGPLADGDALFDPNETLIISEDVCFVDCNGSIASIHNVGWGCYDQICATSQTQDFLDVGDGQANAVFTETNIGSFVDVGYCQIGQRSMEVLNDGQELDPGFGTMQDVAASIVLANGFTLSRNGVTITNLSIAGVPIPSPSTTNNLHNNVLFATDPDGTGVGLEDTDGDGYYDDLPVGNSFAMDYQFEYDCAVNDSIHLDSQCGINDLGVPFSARIDYTNQCDERLIRLESNFYRITHSNNLVESFSDVDINTIEDTFRISLEIPRTVFNFEKNCSGAEEFIATIHLPPGINPVLSESHLYYNFGVNSLPILSSSILNDTLTIRFDGSGLSFLNGVYDLDMAYIADCSANPGGLELYTQLVLYCPPCDCSHVWFCGDVEGPQVHILSPPCAPPTCPQGFKATNFEVNRTTFGFLDSNYTVPFDPVNANKKVAISCDSVEMVVTAIVGDSPIVDSAFARIVYSNVDESASLAETFLFGNGLLRHTRGSILLGIGGVDSLDVEVLAVDMGKELIIDLSNALSTIGNSLQPGDTLELTSNFAVNENGPFGNAFSQVPDLRAEMFSVIDAVEYSCDNFGEVFTIAKSESIVSTPNNNDYPSGCEDVYLEYKLIPVNNQFRDYFGDELRPSLKVDSISIEFDTALLLSYDVFLPELSIPEHPIYGNNFFAMPSFEDYPDGRYVVRLDTISRVPALNDARSFEFNFRIRVVPSCRSEFGSSDGNNIYQFDPTIYYKDRYYARFIGDGSCSPEIAEALDNDIQYVNPPILSILPFTNPNIESTGDTIEFNFQVCNTSFVSDAGLNWFAIIDSASVLDIYSIEDVTDSSNTTDLLPDSFGTVNSQFGIGNGLQKVSVASTFDDNCNVYRVKAQLNACGNYQFQALSGWNCVPFDDPNWTPDDAGSCAVVSMQATARSVDGFLDAAIFSEPVPNLGLCDTNEVTILVRNTGLGRVFDMNSTFYLPSEGLKLVPNSMEVAYPSSAALLPAIDDPVFIGTELRGDKYEYADFSNLNAFLDANGLAGFDPSDPGSTNNELLIKLRFTTDCDYLSGSQIYYDVSGLQGCGDMTNLEAGETTPINLSLPSADPNLAFTLRFDPKTAFISNSLGQLNVIINNIGSIASSELDSVEIKLPNNFIYEPGSSQGVEPLNYDPGEPVIVNEGLTNSLSWALADGVVGGDSIIFNFKVVSPTVDCSIDSIDVIAFTRANTTAICSATGSPCDVEVVTSSAFGSLVTEIPIFVTSFSPRVGSVFSSCSGGSSEEIILNGSLINIGKDILEPITTLYYKVDSDGDGQINPADISIASYVILDTVNIGDTINWVDTLLVSSTDVCGLYLYGDTTEIKGCDPLIFFLPVPELHNAGMDISHCSDDSPFLSYSLGDTACIINTEMSYLWRSPIGNAIDFLDADNVAAPNFNYTYDGTLDTIIYILETTRSGCVTSTDTILIDLNSCVCADPDIVSTVVGNSRCNENIGSIDLMLRQNESNYSFKYHEIFTDSIRTNGPNLSNVPAGAYRISISDQATSTCSDSLMVVVDNFDGPDTDYTVIDANCSNNDGIVTLTPGGFTYLWEDGLEASSRNDLAAGDYFVRIENPGLPGCYGYVLIIVGVQNDLEASYTINNTAACGLADGSATINVIGGSGSYSYSWSSGASTNNAIASGMILVTVADNAGNGCEIIVPVLMTNDPLADVTVTDTIHNSCYQDAGGALVYSVNYDPSLSVNVDTTFTDGIRLFQNGDLPAGLYCMQIEDNLGCIYGGTCFEVKEPNPLIASVSIDPPCVPNRRIITNINGGTEPYNFDWLDVPGSANALQRDSISAGIYGLIITDQNGCNDSISSINVSTCNSNIQYIIDTVFYDEIVNYCFDSTDISITGPLDTIINYCEPSSNGNVNFTIDNSMGCLMYEGVAVGRDTACIMLCNMAMECDTMFFLIDVFYSETVYDTIVRGTDTASFTLNT
ncbi:MAG: hypothetical protein KJP00_12255, partial [Bacteroidia bacterium]|nr:hypothetical protein [Bacteroidia bacterium]